MNNVKRKDVTSTTIYYYKLKRISRKSFKTVLGFVNFLSFKALFVIIFVHRQSIAR